MNCKHCAQEHDELEMLACFESQVKCWRGERDQLAEALNNARTQLAATGCPLCTYINGAVTKSCALHAEVEQLKSDIVKVVEADASEVRNLKLQVEELQKKLDLAYPVVEAARTFMETCEARPKDVVMGAVYDAAKKFSYKRVVPVPLTNQTACCLPHTPGMGCDCGCHRR